MFGELAVEKRYILASGKPEVETSVVDDHSPSVQEKEVEVSATVTRKHKENAIEPVISDDTSVTTTANFHLIIQEEEDITILVRRAADALYDLVIAAVEKAKRRSVEKTKEFISKDINPSAIAARKDAQDIAAAGDSVEGLARTFESLMTEIRKQPYSEQVRLLTGYKKLLKEQINVIDSRINMTERLSSE